MDNQSAQKSAITTGSIITVILIVVLVGGYGFLNSIGFFRPQDGTGSTQTADGNTTTGSAHIAYKDGTYSAIGNYFSPGGDEQMGVTVTLKDSKIVDTSVQVMSQRPISQNMQYAFAQNYRQLVIGKNINQVNLDKVATASLTPQGFNDALDKIKQQAL